MILDANHRSQRSALHQLHFIDLVEIPVLLLEVSVNVPGIPLLGLIHERLQKIAANGIFRSSCISLSRCQGLGTAALVEQARHAASLRIDLHAEEFVFKSACGSLQKGMHRGWTP